MTQQTWTAAVSALCFLIAGVVIAVVPTPFVIYAPGTAADLLGSAGDTDVVSVTGLDTFRSSGRILAPSVQVSSSQSHVTLPEVLYAEWATDADAVPRDWHYAVRVTESERVARAAQQNAAAQAYAAASALRAAGVQVDQIPMVASVASVGPAVDLLYPGDFVLAANGTRTPTVAAVRAVVEQLRPGDHITFTVLRNRDERQVTLQLAASNTESSVPVWGGTLAMGYSYAPQVTFNVDASVGADSGLMLALAVFDRVTDGDLVAGRTVAGVGRIDGLGNVSEATGVHEMLAVAENAGASVFIVPVGNCADLGSHSSGIRIVSVATLDDAITALDALSDPATADLVEGCA